LIDGDRHFRFDRHLRNEAEAQSFRKSILAAPACRISAITKLEASMVVIGRRDVAAIVELDQLLRELRIVYPLR
jgi:uncharacterized protein with PIN domain